jgi:hypothetical protein
VGVPTASGLLVERCTVPLTARTVLPDETVLPDGTVLPDETVLPDGTVLPDEMVLTDGTAPLA